MKPLISILIIVGVIFGGWKLWDYWDTVNQQKEAAQKTPELSEGSMGSMPYDLEQALTDARKKGASGLKAWIERVKKSPKVPEARLAWIQLDYVLMISQNDPVEAKKIFAEVKQKTPETSPVYPRIKKLEKSYE